VKIYLAGKIYANCWRHEIVDGLREAMNDIDNSNTCPSGLNKKDLVTLGREIEFPVLKKAIYGLHDYVGPYFFSCDHGCWHAEGSHGLAELDRRMVYLRCMAAVHEADLVFAWLEDMTCYGTLFELGYARGKAKTTWVALPPDREMIEELWFSLHTATRVGYGTSADQALQWMLSKAAATRGSKDNDPFSWVRDEPRREPDFPR
jgi:nucleoside 2-deoxyribosyltransferase